MIMMSNSKSRIKVFYSLLILIPVSVILIITAFSCSGSRKAAGVQTGQPEQHPLPPPRKPQIYVVVEDMPDFPGGDSALMQYIYTNVRYPAEAKAKGIQGRVIIRFCVTSTGAVDSIHVLRGVHPLLDIEAVRVVKDMPDWTPGKQGGEPVNVWYSVPITFALSSRQQSPSTRYAIIEGDTIFTYVKEMPQFPGGREALEAFKEANLKYPEYAKEMGFGGTVFVNFIVDKDGKLSDFYVTSGISPSLDNEALRVARLMPDWIAGKENDKTVKIQTGTSFSYDPNPEGPPTEVFVVVEEMPYFPGGDTALINFIYRNLKYPMSAKEKKIQGRVITRFCVTYRGDIDQATVLKGVDPALDIEALRVIKMLPKWQPGRQGGKPVNVWYAVPVSFVLDENGEPVQGIPPAPPAPPPPPPPPQPPPATFSLPSGYDQVPEFKGGETALMNFINHEMKYPQEARENKIEGIVKVRIMINEEGSISNASISGAVNPALDAEALRIVRLLPKWQPAKLKGKPVSVRYTIPVTFKLQ
jgi:TonB family protein